MFNLFKSKEYKQARQIIIKVSLDANTLNGVVSEINQFVLILNNNPTILSQLLVIMKEYQLTALKSVKITLIVYRYMQWGQNKQFFQEIFHFLKYFNVKVQGLLQKGRNKKHKYGISTKYKDNIDSSKGMIRQTEYQCENFEQIIMAKIVLPLILIIQKTIFSYDDIYKKTQEIETDEFCWIQLNFIKKLCHLAIDIQDLGRYFLQQSLVIIIALMKIISRDIHKLYKTITNFANRKLATLQSLMQKRLQNKQQIKDQNIQQFLIFLNQIQLLNDNLRLLYCGKYFAYYFIQNQIFCPSIFRPNVYMIEQLHLFIRKGKNINISKNKIKSQKSIKFQQQVCHTI